MNMSSFEIERNNTIVDVNKVIYSGWNTATALLPYAENRNVMPQDLLTVDAERFLKKMYACE
jgi:hypothetical protein